MKKILALLLVLAMALAMVACSTGEGDKEGDIVVDAGEMITDTEATWDTSKEDEIVLSVMSNYYESGWKLMAEEYMKLHPETKVVVDVVADNDTLNQKFVTWFESDDLSEAADITHINFAGIVGGSDLLMERGQAYDFTALLDEVNPYTGTTMRSYLNEEDISAMTSTHGVAAVPFDHVAVTIMVNTTMLEENGLKVPETAEDLLACCETLKANGVETPLLATAEGSYFIDILGDAAMRDMFGDFLVQEGDGEFDAATMQANINFTNDITDPLFDQNLRFSGERFAIYASENGWDTDLAKSIWSEYAKFAPYFNADYLASAATEVLTSFELGEGAFLMSGSWNIGVLNKDVQDMGEDGFDWCTINFPSYANVPEGWATGNLRSLYVMGNNMGIIITGDEDHTARVVDFYQFVYNPVGCAMMYEKTLNDGYFVQGNCAINGVVLPADITAKLEGCIQESPMRSDMDPLFGYTYRAEDQGTYREAFNKLGTEGYSVEDFLTDVIPLWEAKLADTIDVNGYDLDPATKDEHK